MPTTAWLFLYIGVAFSLICVVATIAGVPFNLFSLLTAANLSIMAGCAGLLLEHVLDQVVEREG